MTPSSLPLGLVLLSIMTFTDALQVTPGSSCSSVCGASTSKTNSSEIVCSDYDYYSLGTGSTFMDCIECLQSSNTASDSENDVSWFLYNLRYASAVCIYDFPRHNETQTTTCNLEYACAPLQGALEYGNLNPKNETEYGYCEADSNAFYGTSIDDCVSCLRSSPSTYMANFLLALQAGCQQEPSPGTLLSISGSLFSTTAINTTQASNSASNSSTTSSSASTDNNRVLSVTAIVGIVVGLAVLFLLAAGLFTLYCFRQRRQAREDAGVMHGHSPYPSQYQQQQQPFYYNNNNNKALNSNSSGPGSLGTGQSYAMPHYTVDYKPQSHESSDSTVVGGGKDDDEFSNNAEYYDRLEGRSRGRPLRPLQAHPVRLMHTTIPAPSTETVDTIGILPTHALPTHPAYIPRSTTPGHLGGRASRGGSVRSSSRASSTEQRGAVAKKPSYAMEVFLDAREEEEVEEEQQVVVVPDRTQAPSRQGEARARNIQVELANPLHDSYDHEHDHGRKQQRPDELSVPPPAVSWRSRRASSSPPPPPDRSATATPVPGVSSLILPSVPKIRMPGKNKPPKLMITDPAGVDHDRTSGVGVAGNVGQVDDISGPLAFPDRRFARTRSPNDRIIEQTVDRSGGVANLVEVPIGSGKSYLYG